MQAYVFYSGQDSIVQTNVSVEFKLFVLMIIIKPAKLASIIQHWK